ncbi:immunity protein [Caballeronia catudaia]|uniref:Immunity protein n=1 Tax=Caballeronia catudaia TaxID=1777136 RepID=A0A158BGG1_9BURK|nr:superinfection immunity protein [Caballeronia catudaia]SAK69139.1 immunity protein [Caballeronia catudaia]
MRVVDEILLAIAVTIVYLLPAILADRSKRRSVLVLALFNVLLGWTIIGWFAALYWAFHPESARQLARIARRNRQASARHTIDAIVSRSTSHRGNLARRETERGAERSHRDE